MKKANSKINVLAVTANLNEGHVAVEAKEVSFEGFEEFRFFLHRDTVSGTHWSVTEYKSGATLIQPQTSRAAATLAAKLALQRHGKRNLQGSIDYTVERAGVANQ